MRLNGTMFGSRKLTVKRPSDYIPPEPKSASVAVGTMTNSFGVSDSPYKIFIGGIPAHLTEEQVKELVSAFGPVKNFNLVKDAITAQSKGFAFFEYEDPSVTDKACQGLNGMQLQDKTLLVQRATLGQKNPTPVPLAMSMLNPDSIKNPKAANMLNSAIPIATIMSHLPSMLGEENAKMKPTRVFQVLNIIDPEKDLKHDEDFENFVEDMREECSRYGNILSLHVPRPIFPPDSDDEEEESEIDKPPPPPPPQVPLVGRVLVEYETLEQAMEAQKKLAGRKYNERAVVTSFYPEEKYAERSFDT